MQPASPLSFLRSPSHLFYGWWIALAFMVASTYSAGVFVHGIGALFKPIKDEFGWSATVISIALAMQRLEGGLAAPFVGGILDRVGPRKMFVGGLAVATAGFALLSQAQNLWMFYLGFIVAALGNSALAPTVGLATIAHWFNRNRGKAIAVVISGGGVAGIIVPLMVFLIDQTGWRTGVLIAAGGFWVFSLPFLLIVRQRPEEKGLMPDGDPPSAPRAAAIAAPAGGHGRAPPGSSASDFTFREAVRTRSFWMLGIGFALIQVTISPMLVHVIPALEDEGISRQAAGWAVTGFTLISVASRLGFGWLSDSFNKRWLLVIALALQVGGVLLFATVHNAATLAPFVIVYGIGFGGGLPVRPAIQADYFGRANFGTIQGAFITLSSVSAMASPIIAGAVRDVSGDYDPAFIALAIGSACAAPLLLMAGPPVRRARRMA